MEYKLKFIHLHSLLNTVNRLYIPTVFKDIITKDMVIESIKKQIKQIDNGDK